MKVRVFCSITMIAVLAHSTAFPIAAKDEPSPPFPEEYQELTDPVPRNTSPELTPSPHTDEIPVSAHSIDKLIDYIQKNGIASQDGKSLYLYDILSTPSEILLTYYPDTDTIRYLSGRHIAEEDGTEVTKCKFRPNGLLISDHRSAGFALSGPVIRFKRTASFRAERACS